MKKGLKKAMPVKSSFTYGESGERSQSTGKILKGKGDLRSLPSKNNGK